MRNKISNNMTEEIVDESLVPVRDFLADYLAVSAGEASGNELATRLVNKYGTLLVIATASDEDLYAIKGSRPPVVRALRLLSAIWSRSVCERFTEGKVYSAEELSILARAYLAGFPKEVLAAITLGKMGELTDISVVGDGGVNDMSVTPRRVLQHAIDRGASSVILAHNHPGGSVTPSGEDMEFTEKCLLALKSEGMTLIAHYAVSGGLSAEVPRTYKYEQNCELSK